MNWRLKSLAFRTMEMLPALQILHDWGKRRISRRYLPKVTERSLKSYMIPVDVFRQIPGAATAYEFGAGRGLITPLLLSHAGAKQVHACDLQRLASIEQVNAVITQLARLGQGAGEAVSSFDELQARYNVSYQAPSDARDTSLSDGSVDLIYSTATLEHIPPAQIREIMREMRRILTPGGRFVSTIDYHDHYASADPSVGFMNFYQYGEQEWSRHNTSLHFQNRLRHSDYVRLFEEESFHIHRAEPIFDHWSERDLKRVTLHPMFEHYSPTDLTASNGIFVLGLP